MSIAYTGPTSRDDDQQPSTTIECTVAHYLRTGESDFLYPAWPGSFFERANLAHQNLRGALVREVGRRAGGRTPHPFPNISLEELTRAKVEPMVRGLFSREECDVVLDKVERSVVFLTRDNIEQLLMQPCFDSLAWTLANLYLASLGAPLLGPNAPNLVGLSEENICYVSTQYFSDDDPFADFIVHEVAHIFHNCKRTTFGLRATRNKEWLLDIDFRKRETFAYSCEAYARILERAKSTTERRTLAQEYARASSVSDERVDSAEVSGIIREAAVVRNGWKFILARCAPARHHFGNSVAI
jgi:hypothetical protein